MSPSKKEVKEVVQQTLNDVANGYGSNQAGELRDAIELALPYLTDADQLYEVLSTIRTELGKKV